MVPLFLILPLALGGVQDADPLDQAVRAQSRAYEFSRPSPGIHLSPRAAAAYAMGAGCVPAVMTGRPATEFFQIAPSGRGRGDDGRHAVSTVVQLKEEDQGACTVSARGGDPEHLREAVLQELDRLGAVRTTAVDSGAGSTDSNGSFRQELHCLTLDGRALFLVMSTSSARNRHRLLASLGPDTQQSCPGRAAR